MEFYTGIGHPILDSSRGSTDAGDKTRIWHDNSLENLRLTSDISGYRQLEEILF
ncbi:hypothetical protein PPACK8108_LOCUS11848 [Phakopsora pachyrhizi]|uniref:Uncharacterized protein n=1 Tax=Phakopsora pachyrhizi TaxID=170000 RepID=A0AAV0B416_PHAPC|nr:hypothetical protein PPACK8108_LOCUS11848 [Phakopsora pachyrhizi]